MADVLIVAAGHPNLITKDMVKEAHTKLIKNTIPNANLVIIEGTHFIPVKKHEVFNKEVNEFLDL